jgi:hypothetical protein
MNTIARSTGAAIVWMDFVDLGIDAARRKNPV